jgi:glycosyltransferase involved in cell wall biosynthesis
MPDPSDRAGRCVVVLGSYSPSLIGFRGPLIGELVRRGYRVVAMAPDIGDEVREKLKRLGAEAEDVPIVNNSLHPLSAWASLRVLTARLRALKPEAVIAYTVKPVTLGSLAAARAGVPKFVALVTGLGFAFTEGGGLRRRLSRLVASRLYRKAFRRATSIVFQNPDDRDHFRELGLLPPEAPVTVVNGSGIDVEGFRPVPLPHGPRFLMISRLLGDKGLREYGEAAARLKRRFPGAHFALVGYFDQSPDSLSEQELAQIQAGGVDWLGKMDDVRPAIADCNVYVLPSYREGTPRSVLEAMAMGRAVVTTDAPGCRETVVEGVNGFLVPSRDSAALEKAMERFIDAPELAAQMGARSREIVELKYDVRTVNAALLEAGGL